VRATGTAPDFDVVVVGAGIGGIYAAHRLSTQGLAVLGLEGAPGVGGVWYHNRYPGARVDIESLYYCYYDPQIYPNWKWTERYASQPELLAYLNFAADTWDVKRLFRFKTWLTGARWDPELHHYIVTTDGGDTITCRYLVMTSGQLSKARRPSFAGLDDFTGEWVQTSHWPDTPVATKGKRIAVVGTGASGVQAIPVLARDAEQLYVFQRTANYSSPAQNGPLDDATFQAIAGDVREEWQRLMKHPAASNIPIGAGAAADFSPTEQRQLMEERWSYGGHTVNAIFTDQGTSHEANDIVSEFVRDKVRAQVQDPDTREKLLPTAYPIGTRRLCVDTDYYPTYNRANVTLVDIRADPIETITPTGIKTTQAHFPVDLIVFAIGFDAFTGALRAANIRNESGVELTEAWQRGPRTFLGLMTHGFPNVFLITGPGSPSVLANMVAANVHHIDVVGDMIAYMEDHGHVSVQPSAGAEAEWTAHVAEVSTGLIRLTVENYMVHVNRDDGTRVFMPYAGGLPRFAETCEEIAAAGYRGFEFD
jgi:cation diffusion facilitator CzcD-associated flavoprotein CzcO